MQAFLLVAAGGAIGSIARYGAGLMVTALGFGVFPWATLAVNIVGGFLMGALVGWAPDSGSTLRVLLGVGALGGFTTFSAFSIETVRMLETNQIGAAMAYVASSVVLSVGACWLGLMTARGVLA